MESMYRILKEASFDKDDIFSKSIKKEGGGSGEIFFNM